MGRCSCSGASACACVIEAGDGINVRGAGSLNNPYVIENSAVVERYIQTLDTPSLDLLLEGGGTPANPFVLSGESTLALTELTDVADGQTPADGDVPVWVNGHWEFQPPPSGGDTGTGTPSGLTSVTTGAGVTGAGTGASPLKANVSGVWGSGPMANFPADKTIGVPIYVDNAGQLRARPEPIVRFAVNPMGSFASGWAVGSGTLLWYQKGQEVYFRAMIHRSGASITAGSTGNIGNTIIGALATSLPTPLAGEWHGMVSGTGCPLNVYVDGNRNLIVSGLGPNAKITSGDEFSIICRYWTGGTGVVL